MNSFCLAAEVVVPLVIYMIVGGLICKAGILSLENFKAVNEAIFKVFIPLTLFMNVYDAEIGEVFQIDVFALSLLGILGSFFLVGFPVRHLVKDKRDAATLIQGIYRSNYVLFGMAVAAPLCSDTGIAMIGALAAFVVPLINMLAVILFETMLGGSVKINGLFIRILKNPLVASGILGLFFSVAHIPLPGILNEALSTLGGIATPLALVVLGGILSFNSISRHRKYLIAAVVSRLIAVPLVILLIAISIGIRGDALVALLSIFAAPTAVASAPMAQSMGGNGELAGEIVAATTVFSVFTIFAFVFALSRTGMI